MARYSRSIAYKTYPMPPLPRKDEGMNSSFPDGTYYNAYAGSCFCIGKQNGEPLCPCEMRNKKVFERNGRWIMPEQDLGESNNQIQVK